jgi:hypothetical protein
MQCANKMFSRTNFGQACHKFSVPYIGYKFIQITLQIWLQYETLRLYTTYQTYSLYVSNSSFQNMMIIVMMIIHFTSLIIVLDKSKIAIYNNNNNNNNNSIQFILYLNVLTQQLQEPIAESAQV